MTIVLQFLQSRCELDKTMLSLETEGIIKHHSRGTRREGCLRETEGHVTGGDIAYSQWFRGFRWQRTGWARWPRPVGRLFISILDLCIPTQFAIPQDSHIIVVSSFIGKVQTVVLMNVEGYPEVVYVWLLDDLMDRFHCIFRWNWDARKGWISCFSKSII